MKYLILSLLLAVQLSAATKYCLSSASGTGTGADWTNAYTTVAALETALARGDTGYIGGGAYTAQIYNTSGSGVITIKKATVADHGTSTGWSDTFGTTAATFSGQQEFVTSDWLWDGQSGGGPGAWNSGFGFVVTETSDHLPVVLIGRNAACSNVTVKHVKLIGKGSSAISEPGDFNDGVSIWQGSSITISYVQLTGIGRCPFFTAANGLTAEYIYIESYFSSIAAHSEMFSIWQFPGCTLGNHTIRYSLFTSIQGTGGVIWDNHTNHALTCLIYGNTFYKPAGAVWEVGNGLIGGWTGGNSEDCYNQQSYNNTFINIDQQCFYSQQTRFGSNVAENNFFYNCQSPDYTTVGTHDYNEYNNSGGTHSEAHGSTSTGDQFTSYIALDFTLIGNTTAGLNLGSPYNSDGLGHTRTTWTRGAYEYFVGSFTGGSVLKGKFGLAGKISIQ